MTKTKAEVAAYLRHKANDTLDGNNLLGTLKNALGIEMGTWRQVLHALADLMEENDDRD